MRVPSWSIPLAQWLRNHQLLYARWVRIYEADTSAVSPQRPTVDVEIFEAKDEDIRRLAAMVSSSPEAWLGRQTRGSVRSEEHTSELQSHSDLVCRLLL